VRMNHKSIWMVATTIPALAIVSGMAVSRRDKFTLKLPNELAFSDVKGYEDWQLACSAETDDRMKVRQRITSPTPTGCGEPSKCCSRMRAARKPGFGLPQPDRAGERASAGTFRGPVRSAGRFLFLRNPENHDNRK
jgi:hypothetical protein